MKRYVVLIGGCRIPFVYLADSLEEASKILGEGRWSSYHTKQLFHLGAEIPLPEKVEQCKRCKGSGKLGCPRCSGEGCSPHGMATNGPCTAGEVCPDCKGTGVSPKVPKQCGVVGDDLECVQCGKRLYGQSMREVCPYLNGSNSKWPAEQPFR